MHFLVLAASLGCPIADGTAFGEPYTISATPEPYISEGSLVFEASYSSACPPSSSAFVAERFGEDAEADGPAILASSVMIVVARSPPECASPLFSEQQITETVRTPLPPDLAATVSSKTMFLACPPDSYYEMMRVSERTAPGVAAAEPAVELAAEVSMPADWDEEEDGVWVAPGSSPEAVVAEDDSVAFSDPVKEARRVAEELATHTPDDTVAFLAHCESKLAAGEPCGCCSGTMMDALRKKVVTDAAAARDDVNSSASDANAPPAAEPRSAAVIHAAAAAFSIGS